MPSAFRSALRTTLLAACVATPAAAQQPSPLLTELLKDLTEVEQKLTSLGQAIPAAQWGWRPSAGARTVGEVYVHIAADNYLLPAGLGTAAPTATGIRAEDYGTVQAFEARQMSKEAALAEMTRSFAHLRSVLERASPAGADIAMFGQTFNRTGFLLLINTHLHEHLGQLIAYARSVNVVPPWSRGE